jgi:hypothetical protein
MHLLDSNLKSAELSIFADLLAPSNRFHALEHALHSDTTLSVMGKNEISFFSYLLPDRVLIAGINDNLVMYQLR